MQYARAFGNNDVAFLAWSAGEAIPGCLGFTIVRREGATAEPLPVWVGFEGDDGPRHVRTTDEWPVHSIGGSCPRSTWPALCRRDPTVGPTEEPWSGT